MLLCLFAGEVSLMAQDSICGTRMPAIPSPADIEFGRLAQERAGKVAGIVKVIPVAVHVIYSIEPNDPHNISLSQINSQITQLNADFSGQSGGVDTEIQFCLAGVNRVLLPTLVNVESTTTATALKDSIRADPTRFLNVWVVNSVTESNAFVYAYSTFPQQLASAPELDGIVCRSRYFGNVGNIATGDYFDMGRTMVHEVGHWLSLLHVFHNGCDNAATCATEGDCCCDTPPQLEEIRKCPIQKNTCHDDNPDKKDPLHNFMGYTSDQCRTEFTDCQKARMHLALETFRPDAWFPEGGDCPQLRRPQSTTDSNRGLQVSTHPNPFAMETAIQVTVEGKETPVTVTIMDTQGRIVAKLLEHKPLSSGFHQVRFDAPTPGIYLARVSSPWTAKTIKLVSIAK